MFATWIADVLRGAGLTVVEHDGWQTRGHQDWTGGAPTAVVWHHDASAPGDSPGVPQFLVDRFDDPAGSAGLWVSRQGVWHVIAAGPAWHAGNVLPGKPGNYEAFGVEIDHTTGEDWPPEQLAGLRAGTKALLAQMVVGPDRLEFHRTVADPPGRKVDPDGLDLAAERAALGGAVPPVLPPAPPPPSPQYHPENGDGVLEQWETGPAVADLQRRLGMPPAEVDGVFGPVTKAAVERYQREHGLGLDGIAGPQTLGHLAGGDAPPPPPPHPPWPGRLLVANPVTRGDDVRVWQQRMRDRGWRIDVDGEFGAQSAAIATAFQREKGLAVDGVVGPQTWDAAWTAPVT